MYPHTTVFFFFSIHTSDDSAEDAQVVTDVPVMNNFFFYQQCTARKWFLNLKLSHTADRQKEKHTSSFITTTTFIGV
jgi:hypothetical protein